MFFSLELFLQNFFLKCEFVEYVFERTVLAAEFEERDVVFCCELEHCASCLGVVAAHGELPLTSCAFHVVDAGDFAEFFGVDVLVKLYDYRAAGVLPFECGEGVVGYDCAFADDDGAVADCLRLLHYVRGEYYGLLLAEFFDEVADFNYLVWVEACCRLVEDEYSGVVNHCAGYAGALAVTFGEFADFFILMFAKSHCINCIVDCI